MKPILLASAVGLLGLCGCERDHDDDLTEGAARAAAEAKANTPASDHAAIDEAARIASETGRPVDVEVTERTEIKPREPVPPLPPPGVPPATEERTPGEVVDDALQRAGQGLQRLGERIERESEERR